MTRMKQAKEFREAYGLTRSLENRPMQMALIVEELKEFLVAESEMQVMVNVTKADALKELCDLVYVCYQYAENMGWELDKAMTRVHKSNMSKLGEDGKPIYREDGKVLKGPNYKEPTLLDLV